MISGPICDVFIATQIVFIYLLSAASASGQTAQREKPPMADEVFKNIQVLRGLTVDQFMGTMGFIAAALSMNCSECHDTSSTAAFALDNPRKQMARRMIVMMNALNKANFGGRRAVTCYSCHRGDSRPRVTPRLAEQYAALNREWGTAEIRKTLGADVNTAKEIASQFQLMGYAEPVSA